MARFTKALDMFAHRQSFLRICLCLFMLGIYSRETDAQSATQWESYLSSNSATNPTLRPVQYTSHIPNDVITDYDLNQMCEPCPPGCYPQQVVPQESYFPAVGVDPVMVPYVSQNEVWKFELLPSDLIWHSYWAGTKEPRIAGTFFEEFSSELSLLDVTLGGRTAIARYGARRNGRLEGWELQLEGAGLLRLNLDNDWDFDSGDFRFGVPLIYAYDKFQYKFAYYHLSSHVGDEFLERNPTFTRVNFSRDALVAAISFIPIPAWRWYAEAGWAFYYDGGTRPWEFQFGVDYAQPGPTGTRGTPFLAVNGHIREEIDFGGGVTAQGGWLWRGESGRVLRTGIHYYNGKSNQFEFFDKFEQQLGLGIWQEF